MDEYEAQRTCGHQNVTVTVLTGLGQQRLLDALRGFDRDNVHTARECVVSARTHGVNRLTLPECPVVDVPVQVTFVNGVEHWICPACGATHHEEVDDD